jgi:S-formylglutathione hydrolase FrmB
MVTQPIAEAGFVVYITYQTNDGSEMLAGLEWLIAENARSGSVFEGKLDTTKVAPMGHSLGGLAAFKIAADPRLTTAAHLSGGTMNHADVNN